MQMQMEMKINVHFVFMPLATFEMQLKNNFRYNLKRILFVRLSLLFLLFATTRDPLHMANEAKHSSPVRDPELQTPISQKPKVDHKLQPKTFGQISRYKTEIQLPAGQEIRHFKIKLKIPRPAKVRREKRKIACNKFRIK